MKTLHTGILCSRGVHPVTQAYIGGMAVKPSAQRQTVIDNTVRILALGAPNQSSVLGSLSLLYLLAGHTQQASLLNVLDGANSLIITGAPAFAADLGWTGSLGNVLRVPLLLNAIPGFTQNSNHVGYHSATESVSVNADIGANRHFAAFARAANGQAMFSNSVGYRQAGAANTTTSLGHFLCNRETSSDYSIYQDNVDKTAGGSLVGGTAVATALPASNMYVLSEQNSVSGRRLSTFHMGAGLTVSQRNTLYAALTYYLGNL